MEVRLDSSFNKENRVEKKMCLCGENSKEFIVEGNMGKTMATFTKSW